MNRGDRGRQIGIAVSSPSQACGAVTAVKLLYQIQPRSCMMFKSLNSLTNRPGIRGRSQLMSGCDDHRRFNYHGIRSTYKSVVQRRTQSPVADTIADSIGITSPTGEGSSRLTVFCLGFSVPVAGLTGVLFVFLLLA